MSQQNGHTFRLLPLLALGLLVACGSGEQAADGPAPDSGEVRFVLELPENGPDSVFVQFSTESRPAAWLDLFHEGEKVTWWERCELADCGREDAMVAVCGAAFPDVVTLGGEGGRRSIELRWNRRLSVATEAGCEERIPAPEGEWTARACWAEAWTPAGHGAPGRPIGYVNGPVCTEQTFMLPGPTEVRFEVILAR